MASVSKKLGLVIITLVIVLFVCSNSVFAVGEVFHIYGGSATWGFYDSGYSDGFYWGYSNRHPYTSHEMLSGEWAAAIWWNNCGYSHALWLTD